MTGSEPRGVSFPEMHNFVWYRSLFTTSMSGFVHAHYKNQTEKHIFSCNTTVVSSSHADNFAFIPLGFVICKPEGRRVVFCLWCSQKRLSAELDSL